LNAWAICCLRSSVGFVWYLEYCLEFEQDEDFPTRKGALVDRLIAHELGPEGIVRGPDDCANDEARGVVLSSSIGSSGDSSWEEASKGRGEPGWFSVMLI